MWWLQPILKDNLSQQSDPRHSLIPFKSALISRCNGHECVSNGQPTGNISLSTSLSSFIKSYTSSSYNFTTLRESSIQLFCSTEKRWSRWRDIRRVLIEVCNTTSSNNQIKEETLCDRMGKLRAVTDVAYRYESEFDKVNDVFELQVWKSRAEKKDGLISNRETWTTLLHTISSHLQVSSQLHWKLHVESMTIRLLWEYSKVGEDDTKQEWHRTNTGQVSEQRSRTHININNIWTNWSHWEKNWVSTWRKIYIHLEQTVHFTIHRKIYVEKENQMSLSGGEPTTVIGMR